VEAVLKDIDLACCQMAIVFVDGNSIDLCKALALLTEARSRVEYIGSSADRSSSNLLAQCR